MGKRQSKKHSAVNPGVDVPDAELEVLACLWREGPQTAAEIRTRLQAFRPMAHGSVVTLLTRLSEKRLVTREKSGQGKSFRYSATLAPEPTLTRVVKQLANRVFGGDRVAMLASLLEVKPPTAGELDEMRGMLEAFKKSQGSSGDAES